MASELPTLAGARRAVTTAQRSPGKVRRSSVFRSVTTAARPPKLSLPARTQAEERRENQFPADSPLHAAYDEMVRLHEAAEERRQVLAQQRGATAALPPGSPLVAVTPVADAADSVHLSRWWPESDEPAPPSPAAPAQSGRSTTFPKARRGESPPIPEPTDGLALLPEFFRNDILQRVTASEQPPSQTPPDAQLRRVQANPKLKGILMELHRTALSMDDAVADALMHRRQLGTALGHIKTAFLGLFEQLLGTLLKEQRQRDADMEQQRKAEIEENAMLRGRHDVMKGELQLVQHALEGKSVMLRTAMVQVADQQRQIADLKVFEENAAHQEERDRILARKALEKVNIRNPQTDLAKQVRKDRGVTANAVKEQDALLTKELTDPIADRFNELNAISTIPTSDYVALQEAMAQQANWYQSCLANMQAQYEQQLKAEREINLRKAAAQGRLTASVVRTLEAQAEPAPLGSSVAGIAGMVMMAGSGPPPMPVPSVHVEGSLVKTAPEIQQELEMDQAMGVVSPVKLPAPAAAAQPAPDATTQQEQEQAKEQDQRKRSQARAMGDVYKALHNKEAPWVAEQRRLDAEAKAASRHGGGFVPPPVVSMPGISKSKQAAAVQEQQAKVMEMMAAASPQTAHRSVEGGAVGGGGGAPVPSETVSTQTEVTDDGIWDISDGVPVHVSSRQLARLRWRLVCRRARCPTCMQLPPRFHGMRDEILKESKKTRAQVEAEETAAALQRKAKFQQEELNLRRLGLVPEPHGDRVLHVSRGRDAFAPPPPSSDAAAEEEEEEEGEEPEKPEYRSGIPVSEALVEGGGKPFPRPKPATIKRLGVALFNQWGPVPTALRSFLERLPGSVMAHQRKSVKWLHAELANLYDGKFQNDILDIEGSREAQPLLDFVMEYYLQTAGTQQRAEYLVYQLLASLKEHFSKSPKARMFIRFLGILREHKESSHSKEKKAEDEDKNHLTITSTPLSDEFVGVFLFVRDRLMHDRTRAREAARKAEKLEAQKERLAVQLHERMQQAQARRRGKQHPPPDKPEKLEDRRGRWKPAAATGKTKLQKQADRDADEAVESQHERKGAVPLVELEHRPGMCDHVHRTDDGKEWVPMLHAIRTLRFVLSFVSQKRFESFCRHIELKAAVLKNDRIGRPQGSRMGIRRQMRETVLRVLSDRKEMTDAELEKVVAKEGLALADVDSVLEVVMEVLRLKAAKQEVQLSQLFTTSDTNGDGVLQYTEFRDMMRATTLDISERQVLRMFREAVAASDANYAITPEVFTRVCKRRGLVKLVDVGALLQEEHRLKLLSRARAHGQGAGDWDGEDSDSGSDGAIHGELVPGEGGKQRKPRAQRRAEAEEREARRHQREDRSPSPSPSRVATSRTARRSQSPRRTPGATPQGTPQPVQARELQLAVGGSSPSAAASAPAAPSATDGWSSADESLLPVAEASPPPPARTVLARERVKGAPRARQRSKSPPSHNKSPYAARRKEKEGKEGKEEEEEEVSLLRAQPSAAAVTSSPAPEEGRRVAKPAFEPAIVPPAPKRLVLSRIEEALKAAAAGREQRAILEAVVGIKKGDRRMMSMHGGGGGQEQMRAREAVANRRAGRSPSPPPAGGLARVAPRFTAKPAAVQAQPQPQAQPHRRSRPTTEKPTKVAMQTIRPFDRR